ncbi:MAG: MmcB family DNA repair protein, partial [Hyphomicrobium sp.]
MTDNDSTPMNISTDAQQIAAGAAAILRGVQRLLRAHAFASLSEMPLANNRRADVIAINPQGAIWIVEIKSSIADFRCDQKWPEYRDYCDALLFAVAPDFPAEILPEDTGLIFADAYGGEIMRAAPHH